VTRAFGAEGVGFEPTEPGGSTVFETVRFGRSRIPPPATLTVVTSEPPRCLASASTPRTAAGRLGHDASVLLRICGHVIPARDREAAAILGQLMRGEAEASGASPGADGADEQ
jgi:hypothetical protein